MAELSLFTVPSSEIYRPEADKSLVTPHEFDKIVGIGMAEQIAGTCEGVRRTLEVPLLWGEKLLHFAKMHVLPAEPAPQEDTILIPNCHRFATFMITGQMINVRPEVWMKIPLSKNPEFGQPIVLGDWNYDRGNYARHSAIGLGEQAPGRCIQLTGLQGVLAIDDVSAVEAFYAGPILSPKPTPEPGWFCEARPKLSYLAN